MNGRGKAGEDFAAGELIRRGYSILARNFHSRYGEIDIIAVKGGVICFVEVKTRRRNAMVGAEESITAAKQKRIIKTALTYIQETGCRLQPRFDLFGVTTGGDGAVAGYDHMKGAFDGTAYEKGY